ncbi:MAG: arginyl-tRNA--protein transferase, partial [Spirosomaceae bacterium]|nr:arginyl-tRNA--protein transferase [Spirosomataceae bacterium]
ILTNFELSKSQQKKTTAANRFTFKVQPFKLTDEKEQLYADYKTGISFNTASSLYQLLFDYQDIIPLNTYEVATYDGNRLIGLGVFDLGKNAAAGIVSFAHPDYKKYSLGAVIILKKIQFAKEQGLGFFYPGYFAPGYPACDYKLTFGKSCTEFYNLPNEEWVSKLSYETWNDSIALLYEKMNKVIECLEILDVPRELLIYDFFDLNLTLQFNGQQLFDIPLIVPIRQRHKYQLDLITYDLILQEYQLIDCEVVYYLPKTTDRPGHFNQNILRRKRLIKSATTVEKLLNLDRST